jgi:hypothetical protein
MLWDIWVQPNKIIEEEFPDGWSHDDVMDAAQNRYAGKVTNVAPSPVGGRDNYSSPSRSEFNFDNVSGWGALALIGFIIWVFIEYWMFAIPISLIFCILIYFATKEK